MEKAHFLLNIYQAYKNVIIWQENILINTM